MLDIRFIREHADEVQKKAEQKGYDVDVPRLLRLEQEINQIKANVDAARHERNKIAEKFKKEAPTPEEAADARKFKDKVEQLERHLNETLPSDYKSLIEAIPNIFPDDTPLGGEEANKEIRTWGNAEARDVKDHLSLAEEKGWVDFERGAKVAGNKHYYLKSSLVELELALLQFAVGFAKQNGFWPMSVPHMVSTKTLEGAGFSARGKEKQIYKIEEEDLNLIATAEIPLTGYFADEIMPNEWLPSKMVAWSPSYRVEGGAYGKHNRGLFRVHQFNKVELYELCKPQDSEAEHQKLLELEEKFCQEIEVPYRVVRIAAGDLGAPAYKKFDIEYWSPAEKAYRELMSCSNVTNYQARRLNIRYKNADNKSEFVHTLNATLAATGRLMIAIMENNQTKDGKVSVPKVLQPLMNGQTEI